MEGKPSEQTTVLGEMLIKRVASYCGLKVEDLTRDSITNDIGLDSLSLAQILAALEAEFAFELVEEDVTNLLEATSIGNYMDILVTAMARTRSSNLQESPAI